MLTIVVSIKKTAAPALHVLAAFGHPVRQLDVSIRVSPRSRLPKRLQSASSLGSRFKKESSDEACASSGLK
jgi:hypothetical protein